MSLERALVIAILVIVLLLVLERGGFI